MIVDRCDPRLRGRVQDDGRFGLTMLHSLAGSRDHMTPEERLAFAAILLNAGARLDLRDHLLQSAPLAWARKMGRGDLLPLLSRAPETAADPG